MVSWLLIVLAVPAAVLALLVYLSYFSKNRLIKGVYCEGQYPLIGNWIELLSNIDRMHDWKLDQARRASALGGELVQRAGPFLGVVELISPRMVQFLLRDNFDNFIKGDRFKDIFFDLLGHGIFNTDFEEWRTQRKIASHMFSASKLNEFMMHAFKKHARTFVRVLEAHQALQRTKLASDPTIATSDPKAYFVDLQQQFLNFTMEVICEVGFGLRVGAIDGILTGKPQLPFVAAFDKTQEALMYRFLGPPLKWKIQRLLNRGTEKVVAEQLPIVLRFIDDIVQTRKENAAMYEDAGDLLSLFVADGLRNGKQMDNADLRDTVTSFLLAGRDTTASLLTWLLYEISMRPEVREQIAQEIEQVFGAEIPAAKKSTGKEGAAEEEEDSSTGVTSNIDHDTLKNAVYLEAVVMETLRLHPPIATDNKRAVNESTFPDGTVVPAGHVVTFSPYTMGRLESIWGPDVLEFKPERWLSEELDEAGRRTIVQKSAYAFPQFNAGFRLCLGRGMAILETKLLAVVLLRRFRFRVQPGLDPMYKINIVTFMKNGLPVEIENKDE